MKWGEVGLRNSADPAIMKPKVPRSWYRCNREWKIITVPGKIPENDLPRFVTWSLYG
jgi:hypothetical protein